jgi:hypothetical protein
LLLSPEKDLKKMGPKHANHCGRMTLRVVVVAVVSSKQVAVVVSKQVVVVVGQKNYYNVLVVVVVAVKEMLAGCIISSQSPLKTLPPCFHLGICYALRRPANTLELSHPSPLTLSFWRGLRWAFPQL